MEVNVINARLDAICPSLHVSVCPIQRSPDLGILA